MSQFGPAREGKERGFGRPRSEEERAGRHERLHPGTSLPPRGTGLSGSPADAARNLFLASLIGGTIIAIGLAYGSTRRK